EWRDNPNNPGVKSAVLYGDPTKPGPYVVRVKWLPGNMSRPHSHPNDRFIVVLSGTWWAGTGEKFDPENTIPMPAGSFVTHFGGKVHYDGAKDEEAVLQIHGKGPATTTYVHAGHRERAIRPGPPTTCPPSPAIGHGSRRTRWPVAPRPPAPS